MRKIALHTHVTQLGHKEETELEVWAIDVGYGALKALSGQREVKIPSYIAADVGAVAAVGRLHDELAVDDATGQRWMVGDLALTQCLMPLYSSLSDRTADTIFDVMLRAGLVRLAHGAAEPVHVNLVTGLPPEQQMDPDRRQALAARIRGTYDLRYRLNDQEAAASVIVEKVKCPPQAMGTFLDLVLDDRGEPRPEVIDTPLYFGTKLVIDVGGGTTDLLGIDGLSMVYPVTRTLRQGMQWVYGELRRHWRQLPLGRIERMVLDGEIDPGDQVRQLAATIVAEASNLLDVTGFAPQIVIVTGGPARLIRPYLTLGEAVIVAGDLNNVRGYRKWGVRPKAFATAVN